MNDAKDPRTNDVDPTAQDRPEARSVPFTGDERLLLDVVEALRGADNLRERLLATLQSGSPSVSDLAYAVKARVKEDYKAIDKIKDRRAGKPPNDDPRPNYSIRDVTDLVGLRIVTLYRLDVLEVIRTLLDTIAADTSPTAPFVAGSVTEVTIYSTNPTGDVQELPQRLMKLFEERSLGSIAKIAEKPSNYSSIHIVLRGRGKYRDGYRDLPVEIQIRTALEDVWGQIEHSLKYKRKKLMGVGQASRESAQIQTTLSHLGALKTMIDGIAQYGDQIKLQIDQLEPSLRYSNVKTAEETSVRLSRLTDLPAALRDETDAAIVASKPAMAASYGSPEERSRTLRLSLSRLDVVSQELADAPRLRKKTREEAAFVIDMQRALILFQLGNLGARGGSHLQKALAMYTDLERRFPKRLVISYRLSQTMDAVGARSDAVSKLRQIMEQLDVNAEPTPKEHWIRAAVPRLLGVLLWEAAKSGAVSEAPKGPSDDPTISLLREAYEVTSLAYSRKVFDDNVRSYVEGEHEKAANNLLYFLLEYLEAGGRERSGMERSDVQRLLSEIGGDDPASIIHLDVADTARRAHAYLGAGQKESACAAVVIRLAGPASSDRSPIIRDAVRAAQRTLDAKSDDAQPRSPNASDGRGEVSGEAPPPQSHGAGREGAKRTSTRSRRRKGAVENENKGV